MGWKRLPDTVELCDGTCAHLLHHVAPMELDGDLADPEIESDLLVHRAGDHKMQHLPFAHGECFIKGKALRRYAGNRPSGDVGGDGCRHRVKKSLVAHRL